MQNVDISKNHRNPPVFSGKIIDFGRLVFVSVSLRFRVVFFDVVEARGPRSPDGDARGPSIYIYIYIIS